MLKILAKKIVDELFTNGDGDVATRIDLKHGKSVETECSLGGLCRAAAEDRVYHTIKRCMLDSSFWEKAEGGK